MPDKKKVKEDQIKIACPKCGYPKVKEYTPWKVMPTPNKIAYKCLSCGWVFSKKKEK